MLIDYPEIKNRIQTLLYERMQRGVLHPLFDAGGIRIAHEGNRFSVAGQHGWVHTGEFKEASTLFEIPIGECENLSFDDILRKVDSATNDLVAKKSKMIYESLDDVTRKTGNVIDARGNPTPDHLFEMIEKMEMSFDASGRPQIAIVSGPDIHPKIMQMIQAIESDPALKRHMDALMDKKRQQWRDRQSSRTLAG